MPVQIGQRESDFNNPLGLLSDCHRRIERFLAVLLTVVRTRRGGPLEPSEASSLGAALDYFRSAAPQHTADEEDSLFPRMRAAGVLNSLDALEDDHQQAAAALAEIDTLGRTWLHTGSLPSASEQRMTLLLRQLAETYERHIAIEDTKIFPAAARVLDKEQIAAVGREMETRRKLPRTAR